MTGTREQLLTGLRERIVAYAASRVGRDFAEDLAQEVLLVLEAKYGYLESVEDLVPSRSRFFASRCRTCGANRPGAASSLL